MKVDKIQIYYFEILATNTTGEVTINDEELFCYNLMSNGSLWNIKPIMEGGNTLYESKSNLKIIIKKSEEKDDLNQRKQKYILTISGTFDTIQAFRLKILEHLQGMKFDFIYVLEDEISESIAKNIYPSIYKVESFLRKYVIKFFAIKLGHDWWKITADTEMKKKIIDRQKNETIFSKFIDNEVYLIDFGELGKLIYSQSSGNLSRDDIIAKIIKLENSIDSIELLKKEVQTNYNKFFKETFKENKFQENWEELEKIRHKIAHNNLFTISDQEATKMLVANLINTIKKANEEIDKLTFSVKEREQIMNNFASIKITKDIFLKELQSSILWANNSADGFVGLQNFIVNILGSKGYEFQSTRDLVANLEKEGVVEIYSYENKQKNLRPVSSIRFKI